MGVLWFLLVPIIVVAVGSSILVLRQRQPRRPHSSIDAFKREMRALAPDDDHGRRS
jgi:hypothetical protein